MILKNRMWEELMNYTDYVNEYNLGDHGAFVRKFYTDDVVFESGALKRICRG